MPRLHQPVPRRTFEITPASSESSRAASPEPEAQNPELLMKHRSNASPPPSRTRSILNLTSSTLLGIYSGATDGAQQELHTPWGTGAQTPAQSHRASLDGGRLQIPSFPFTQDSLKRPIVLRAPKRTFRNYYLPLFFQTIMLFGFGMGFGSLITHLHVTQQITPVPVPSNANSKYYQIAWGLMGVIIGNALPQLDVFFDDDDAVADGYDSKPKPYQHVRTASSSSRGEKEPSLADNGLGPIWHSAVRSVGAFVGIAFALVGPSCSSCWLVTDLYIAQNPLAVDAASFDDISCGRPYLVVYHRSVQAWPCAFFHHQHWRDHLVSFVQPAVCTCTRNPFRADIGEGGGVCVVSEHLILHELVFRSYWSKIAAMREVCVQLQDVSDLTRIRTAS